MYASVIVVFFTIADASAGQGRRALRLLAAGGLAAAGVALAHRGAIALLIKRGLSSPQGGFLPTLAWLGPLSFLFAVPGLGALCHAPAHLRRLLAAAAVAGTLRTVWMADGALLLTGPLAIVAAAGLVRLWRGSLAGAELSRP